MFFVKLLRFLKGTVRFRLTGGFVERFLNLCANRGIPLWDLTPTDAGVEADTAAAHYRGLRPLAKRTGVHLRLREKKGLPFLLRRYKKRRGIAVGMVAFALFLTVMSNFIWVVEVRGNERVPTQEILVNLESLGVRPGCLRRSINTRMTERSMLVQVDDLAWIAINLRGSTATVEVKERTIPPKRIDDDGAPANIIAAKTGQIKQIEAYVGQSLVKVGDTVVAGDILVSGITEDQKGNNDLKQARAKIIAQVEETLEISIPLQGVSYTPTGETTLHRSFGFFGLEIPLHWPGEVAGKYNRYEKSRQLELFGQKLPFTLKVVGYEHLLEEESRYTPEEAMALAESQLKEEEALRFAQSEILAREAAGEVRDNCLILTARYTVEEDIAKTQEILVGP